MKHVLKCTLLLLLAAGCSVKNGGENIEQKIEAKANACKGNANCTVKIADVTSFKWDTVYVFNYPVSKNVVENTIDADYPEFVEGTRPMIFKKEGKIVYSENNPDGLRKGSPGQVIFKYTLGFSHGNYLPANTFRVKIEASKGKTFYELY